MSLAWDIIQRSSLRKTAQVTELALSKVDGLASCESNTKQDLEELTLACRAMWELHRDHLGFTDDYIKAKILEGDNRGGVVDGRIGSEVVDCRTLRTESEYSQAELYLFW